MCTDIRHRLQPQRGFTLIELVITIVIVGVIAAGLIGGIARITQSSADPMLARQSLAIAESYMDEIQARGFLDPTTSTVCPAAPGSRANFDNVCDYNGLSGAPADDTGAAIAGLGNYSVSVTVAATALNTVTSANAVLITVTVTDPKGNRTVLSGYRARY